MGAVEIGTLRRTAGYDKKRLTGYNPARRYLMYFDAVLHRIVHLLGYKSPLPGTGFFLAGKFLPDYVETLCASRRLPPKAAVSFSTGSSSPIRAWRTAALKCVSKPPPGENVNCAHKATCPATVFFFSRLSGQIKYIFILLTPQSILLHFQ